MQKVKYIFFVSLGCSKNFVDTEVMAASLVKNGLGITSEMDMASICVINTCAFIPPARAEAESNIQEFILWKKQKKSRKLIVTGCLSEWDKKKIYYEKYPEVDVWIGLDEIPLLPEKISLLYSENPVKESEPKHTSSHSPEFLYDENNPRLILTPPGYAFIKIADGCNNRCSYCSIPSIRGNLRSRSIVSVEKEMRNLLASGTKEIILIAQDITAFSRDRKDSGESLSALLRELDKIEGDYWLRLHYLHPDGIKDELIETINSAKHIIPYLDIPLQHISDSILHAMNRKTGRAEIEKKLEKLRKIKDLAIRTTFLVGFPGETDEKFEELVTFVKENRFHRLGVFPFYPEDGTKAAAMEGAVPFEIAQKRAEIIQKIHEENSLKFNLTLVGKNFNVILDSVSGTYAYGRTYMDSPDIDNTVVIKTNKKKGLKAGEFRSVKIESCSAYELNAIINI